MRLEEALSIEPGGGGIVARKGIDSNDFCIN